MNIRIKRLSAMWLIIDWMFRPVMYIGAGTIREKAQETHRWHIQKLSHTVLPKMQTNLSVSVTSNETSVRMPGYALFHLPIFGGWKEYVVLEAQTDTVWHIGWHTQMHDTGECIRFDLHLLPLPDKKVRMLKGLKERTTTFFAVDENGQQIPLKAVGSGTIRDKVSKEFWSIRLL